MLAPHCCHFFVTGQHVANWCNAIHHVAKHVFGWVELRLLFQQANGEPGRQARLAGVAVVFSGHDAQQAGFAAAVRADDTNFGAGVERQRDVFKNGAVWWVEPSQFVTRIYKFCGHDAVQTSGNSRLRGGASLENELDARFSAHHHLKGDT